MPERTGTVPLTRQERLDFAIIRRFPKLSGRGHRFVLRVSRGRLANSKRGIPVGLLTATGARSGKPRTVPLMHLADGARFLVVPANAGLAGYPAWYHNLRAHPEAVFTVQGVPHEVRARLVDGDERDALWPRLVAHNPIWAASDELTTRHLPVIALEPR